VALLHALRANDRLAISKLVTSLVRGSVRSPLAQCLLVRYVSQVRQRLPLTLTMAPALALNPDISHSRLYASRLHASCDGGQGAGRGHSAAARQDRHDAQHADTPVTAGVRQRAQL